MWADQERRALPGAERLYERWGVPWAETKQGETRGGLWLVEDRILLLYGEGRVSPDAAHWATDTMDAAIRDAAERHDRRFYIAWSFEGIETYGASVGAHFVQWFHRNRRRLVRTTIHTENTVLRMTAKAASLAFAGAGSFPDSIAELDEVVDGWVTHIRTHR